MAGAPEFEAFAIDLDGVVWLSREPIEGSAEAIERLRATGAGVAFVTNDPRSTREELAARLTEIGAPTNPDAVLTSASACAEQLADRMPGARVMALGTSSLTRELRRRDLDAVPVGPDGDVAAVVVGGGAAFDYETLRWASAAVRGGAELWATNKDPTYPTAQGLVPGTGAIVAALEVASGVEAVNVGKPEPALFLGAAEHLGVEPARVLMAGDSLLSDIAGAAEAGLATALILTGRDSTADIEAAPARPGRVYGTLAALAEELAAD